ncbi:MAG: radical SAM protein, partial [Anaerolineales bacterium]|nr:radical SAM protein [Anaerolineales bacterium]
QKLADSVLAGEAEEELVNLVNSLAAEGSSGVSAFGAPQLVRLNFPAPLRTSLPPLTQYAHYLNGQGPQLAGYVEASRGCLHTCQHCPITPVYHGRFFVVPADVVLADIEQQVKAGARHITFGDPDFLNGPNHALTLARAVHARWPQLTFDFTTKVEHILQHKALFTEFARLGCTFVVSAIESVSDEVLAQLHKGHTAAEIDVALKTLEAAGIGLQPTLVAFTPWTRLEDYAAQIEWIAERGLIEHIPPVQLSIRLLLPPGSLLAAATQTWLGPLEAENFTYRWTHPDARMETLYAQVAARVAEAEQCGEAPAATFEAIRALAYAALGHKPPTLRPLAPYRPAPPRLTENWFC